MTPPAMAPIRVPVSCLVSQPMSTSAAAHSSITGRIQTSPVGSRPPSSTPSLRESHSTAECAPRLGQKLGQRSSDERKRQPGAEAADLGTAKFEPTAVGVGEVRDDRMPEPGAWLGLVQPASANDGFAQLLFGEARPVVLDPDLK